MTKFYTLLVLVTMALSMPQFSTATQTRPGNTTNITRPGQTNTRPDSKHDAVTRPGNNANRPGSNNTTVNRPGNTVVRPGSSTVLRPGTPTRPTYVTPPTRPNRMPTATRPRPVRPSTLRPGTVHFSNTTLGLQFGTSLMNSLNYLYGSNYSVDGYGADEVYLRNVKELNYVWTDATLFYNYGSLYQSMFYQSTIGYNTSRYYGVYNSLRARYGNPYSTSSNGRNLSATWWSAGGEYITLEYSQMNSSNGYRYFTILTYGR